MANIVDELIKKLQKIKDDVLKNEAFKKKLALETAEQIRVRTRLGYGVNQAGKQEKLKPLRPKTVEQRERYKKRLHPKTTVGRSNLTATGQLLDSITGDSTSNGIEIYLSDKRVRELSGSTSVIGNQKLSEYVETIRPFLDISIPEQNDIERKVRDELERRINNILT